MHESKRSSNVGFAPISAAVLLAGACWLMAGDPEEETSEPDASMTLDQAVAAMAATPTQGRSTLPLCDLELKQFERPMSADWYSCHVASEVYESLPIGQLDAHDFMGLGGIAWQSELRRLHGASIELPKLHPSSAAYRLGWREGDHLAGFARIGSALVANLERGDQQLVLVYTID